MYEKKLEELRITLSLDSNQEQKEKEEDILKAKLKNIMSCLKVLVLHGFAKPIGIKNSVINWYYNVLLRSLVMAEDRGLAIRACRASRGIRPKLHEGDKSDETVKKQCGGSAILDFVDILQLQDNNVKQSVTRMNESQIKNLIANLMEITGKEDLKDFFKEIVDGLPKSNNTPR